MKTDIIKTGVFSGGQTGVTYIITYTTLGFVDAIKEVISDFFAIWK